MKHVEMIMSYTKDGLTPLDVAADHSSNEAAIVLLNFFEKHFNIIEKVFLGNKMKNKIQIDSQNKRLEIEAKEDLEYPWSLKKVHRN